MFWPVLVACSATAVQNKTASAMSQKPAAMPASFRKALELFHFPPMSSRKEDPWRLSPQAPYATTHHSHEIVETYVAARCGSCSVHICSVPKNHKALFMEVAGIAAGLWLIALAVLF